jgi:hypothetical protein
MRTLRSFGIALTLLGLAAAPALALNCAKPVDILRYVAPQPHPLQPPFRDLELAPLGIAMAIRIKDTGSLAKKFSMRAGQAVPDYTSGVQAAGNDWQTGAKAGESNYEQGVAQSIADKRYGKGIDAAGAGKYVENAVKLGSQRYGPGVANAEGAWARNVQPHLDAMKSLDLPAKGPKGSAQNQQRAQIVAARNRAIKLGK